MELDDIEDMIENEAPVTRLEHTQIQPKIFKGSDVSHGDGVLPGKGNIYIKTWGCSHNNSDGEYMAGLLASEGA